MFGLFWYGCDFSGETSKRARVFPEIEFCNRRLSTKLNIHLVEYDSVQLSRNLSYS